jgi:hypothetical protein
MFSQKVSSNRISRSAYSNAVKKGYIDIVEKVLEDNPQRINEIIDDEVRAISLIPFFLTDQNF